MHRRRLLAERGITLPEELREGVGDVGIDDVLDAAMAAWSVRRYQQRAHEIVKASATEERAFVVV